MQINESIENYLEEILIQQQKSGFARSVDIAANLKVTKASVSHSMKLLRENGFINMAESGKITLSETGAKIAKNMYERHSRLSDFLLALGVSRENAVMDACKIEHDISAESFAAICAHAEKIKND